MVVILSDKENSVEKEIARLLCGIELISVKGEADITLDKGIIIMTDEGKCFQSLKLNKDIIGICSDTNSSALSLFKRNGLPIITCGTGSKNTLTVSSIREKSLMLSLQRSIKDLKGRIIEPLEIKTECDAEDCFSVMAVTAVRLIYGV